MKNKINDIEKIKPLNTTDNKQLHLNDEQELAIKNIHQTVKEVAGVALDKLVGISIAEEKLNITIDKLLEKDKQ